MLELLENNGNIGKQVVRSTYFFEVRCDACRVKMERGNRLEASVQMVNHMYDRHVKEDWKNLLDAQIMKMYWNSPAAGHSLLEVDEIMSFLALLAKDQDIPYEYWQRFHTKNELNGV